MNTRIAGGRRSSEASYPKVAEGSWMTGHSHRLSLSFARALVAVLAAALACGGGSGNPAEQDAGFTTMGMPGVPSPTRVGANLVFADVAVDGKTGGRLGFDLGAPI